MKRALGFTEEQWEEVRRKRSKALSFLKGRPVKEEPPTKRVLSSLLDSAKAALKQGSELVVYQLAQDFVLDNIVAPMVKTELPYKRHLPVELWTDFDKVPGLSFFQELACLPLDANLIEEFASVYPDFVGVDLSRLVQTDAGRRQFMSFVFWFVASVFITKEVQFYWKSDIGFGVKVGKALSRSALIQGCWGRKVLLNQADIQKNKLCDSSTMIVRFMDKSKVLHCFAVFGPLSFVQQSCRICANASLFPGNQVTRMEPMLTEVTEDVLTLCYSLTDLRIGEELFFSIKPSVCLSPRHKAVHTAPLVTL